MNVKRSSNPTQIRWCIASANLSLTSLPDRANPLYPRPPASLTPHQAKKAQLRQVGWGLLVYLMQTMGQDHWLEKGIYRTAQGRPILHAPHLDFNLSHSGDQVAVILAINHQQRPQVGIDIEMPRHSRPYGRLLTHFATAEEIAWWHSLPPHLSTMGFYRCWCLRESLLKASGIGLRGLSNITHQPANFLLSDPHFSQGSAFFTPLTKGYLAYACNAPNPEVQWIATPTQKVAQYTPLAPNRGYFYQIQ